MAGTPTEYDQQQDETVQIISKAVQMAANNTSDRVQKLEDRVTKLEGQLQELAASTPMKRKPPNQRNAPCRRHASKWHSTNR